MTTVVTSTLIKRQTTNTTTITTTSGEMSDIYSNLLMVRPRKYSEGSFREMEEVDSLPGEPSELSLVSTSTTTSSVESGSFSNLPCTIHDEIHTERTSTETCHNSITGNNTSSCSSSNLPNQSLTVNGNTTVKIATALPLRHCQSFLDSLPLAMAYPETATAQVASVSVVATHVVRLPSNELSTHRNASLITVKLFKATQESKIGIRLQLNKEGNLQIGRVAGFLTNSPLRCGDEVLRLNGQDVSAWTTTKALKYLREAWGWITIVVRNPQSTAQPLMCLASVRKRSPSDKLGVSFERQTTEGPLTVRGLNVAGLLGGGTSIRVGDVLESINHIPCTGLDNHETTSIIRSLPDWVHILVRSNAHNSTGSKEPVVVYPEHPLETVAPGMAEEDDALETMEATEICHSLEFHDRDVVEPSLLSLTVYKLQKTERLGLSLVKLDDAIYINKITGLLAGSILKEGMALLSINQRLTSKMTLAEATTYLRDRVGSVTFLATNPHGNPKYVQAMVYKRSSESTKNSMVGISFKGSEGRQLKLCEIRDDGLFVESCLNVGDSIIRVNDIPCHNARPKDAVDLIRGNPVAVSILAKSKSKAGVVVAHLASKTAPSRSNFVASRTA